jgi:hypothetical protein
MAPGVYNLAIGIYWETGERLRVTVDDEDIGDTLTLTEAQVDTP